MTSSHPTGRPARRPARRSIARIHLLVGTAAAAVLLSPLGAIGSMPDGTPVGDPGPQARVGSHEQHDGHDAHEGDMFARTRTAPDGTAVIEAGHAVRMDPTVIDDPAVLAPQSTAASERLGVARGAGRDARNAYPTGTTVAIKGTVVTKPRRGARTSRPVRLSEKRSGTWKVIRSARSTKAGAVTFRIGTGSRSAVRTFRIEAPRFKTLAPSKSRPTSITVTKPTQPPTQPPVDPDGADPAEPLPAGYDAQGSPGDWTYLRSGGTRWNPCQVIRWSYNPTAQGYSALGDVKRSFAKVAGVTGLRFKYVGATDYRYLGSLGDYPTEQTDVVVGWANQNEYPVLGGNVVGVGGGYLYSTGGTSDVDYRMDNGFLTLDNGHAIRGGFAPLSWGQVILHEVLHAMGLGHASEQIQLMFGSASASNYQFGAGDITGMERVGASRACIS